ncbi:MAG: hypothetical protein A2289_16350 [Deltaproteobacteria bacterium RIFOXYA12_FULL_58_15]|nr:MAG: hypothetical protein A2289_16350 [Deltaproteobacteria bacterium RIFOXYA12_FULL_58_15]OGR13199.1 MAG: hypothetical protein A2341_15295 [Deltaproteobacteria bacterium RIFOXYB12_FULL_58_9]
MGESLQNVSHGLGQTVWLMTAAVACMFAMGCNEAGQTSTRLAPIVAARKRSVVLITLDTTRADHLQPYGANNVPTPTLMALANHGIVFEQVVAVAPITLVAHTSILSGLYPPEHGVRNNGIHYVPEDVQTLAEILQGKGFRTAAFVSAAVLEKRYGLSQGFDVYDDDLSKGRLRQPRMVPDRPAGITVDAARTWLDGLSDRDHYFLWVHLYDPHAPYSPPPPYRRTYRERMYDGEIAYVDEQIGRLLAHPRINGDYGADEVDDANHNNAPWIHVLGDHGESLGQHSENTHALLAYESTLRVPWIMSGPGIKAMRVTQPVSQVDLLPTVLDQVDLDDEIPQGLKGISQIRRPSPSRHRGLYAETYLPYYTYGWAKLRVLRFGPWKLIDSPEPELFNVQRDPNELSNLIEQQPDVAFDLRADFDTFVAGHGEADKEANLEVDADAMAQLAALGYVAVGSSDRYATVPRPDPKKLIDVHVALERARHFIRDRLYDHARSQLEIVLGRDPNNLAALLDLAEVQASQNRLDEGIITLTRALELDPRYTQSYLSMARLEARRGDLQRALTVTQHALDLDPKSLEGRLQQAQLLAHSGKLDEAERRLREALYLYPGHPRLLLTYAQLVEIRKGELDAAEKTVRAALDSDPFLLAAWLTLGDLLARKHQEEAAAAAYQEGLEREPDDPVLHAELGLLLARYGKADRAERHLREAIRLSSVFRSDVHVSLGALLAESGRWQEAKLQYDKVLEDNPKHPGARNNLAIAKYRGGRVQEALADLSALVQEFPRHADAHNNLAAIAIDRKGWRAAEQHARRALQLREEEPAAWNNLGLALDEQGKRAEALDAYQKGLEEQPLYWQARLNMGVLLRKQNETGRAAAALKAVVDQVPHIPEGHFELGMLYAGRLDDHDLARTYLNTFLRIAGPNHPNRGRAEKELANLHARPVSTEKH